MLWMVLCSYISAVYVLLCMKLCLFACHCHTPLNLLVCHATLAWQYVMGGLSAVYVLLLYIVCMKLCLFAWHCHAPLNLLGSLPGPEISGSNFLFILQNQKTKGDISVLTERRTPVETMTLHTGPEWHVYHTPIFKPISHVIFDAQIMSHVTFYSQTLSRVTAYAKNRVTFCTLCYVSRSTLKHRVSRSTLKTVMCHVLRHNTAVWWKESH